MDRYSFAADEFETVRKTVDKMTIQHGLRATRDFFLLKAENESGRRKVLFQHGFKYIKRAADRAGV